MFKRFIRNVAAFALATAVILSGSMSSMAYTIKSGDSLGKIAAENSITVDELMQLNGIANPNKIYVGEEIKVSKEDTTVVKLSKKSQSESKISGRTNGILKSMFNAKEYAEMYPGVVEAVGDSEAALYEHFVNYGLWEGRQPNKDFNVNAYASAYADLEKHTENLGLDAEKTLLFMYEHYDAFGKNEKREVTTIEKAKNAGVTVKSIATANDADGKPLGGTVISGNTPARTPDYTPTQIPNYYMPTAEKLALVAALTVTVDSNMVCSISSTKSWSEYEECAFRFVLNGEQVYHGLPVDGFKVGHMLGDTGTYTLSCQLFDTTKLLSYGEYSIIDTASTTFTYTKAATKLATPTNISYDPATEKFTWDAVPNATGYYVEYIITGDRHFGPDNPRGKNTLWSDDSSPEFVNLGTNDDVSSFGNAGIKVKAYGPLDTYENSDWAEYIYE